LSPKRSHRFRPCCEALEDRWVPALTLDTIANVNLPTLKSIIIPLTADDTENGTVSYTVSSDNSAITARILTGPFLRFTLSSANPSLNGQTIDLQLYSEFAPNNVQRLTDAVNNGFYNGKSFYRLVPGFVIQGGNQTGTGNDFADEYNANSIYTGVGQLAYANSGDDTNDSEFFITTTTTTPAERAQQRALDFNFTLLGQVVRGQSIVDLISQQPRSGQSATPPITIQSAQIVTNTEDATLVISATSIASATITVTADDGPGGDASVQQIFTATSVVDTVNDPPFLGPITNQTTTSGNPVTFTLTRTDLENDPSEFQAILQGASVGQATVVVNGAQVTVTPNADFTGVLTLKVGVKDQGATFRGNDTDPFDTQIMTITVTAPPDTTGPSATITAGPPTVSTSTNATFSFTGSDPTVGISPTSGIDFFEASLDGATFTRVTSPVTFDNLAEGSHTFRVRAVDMAGNVGTAASSTWSVDLAPTVTIDSADGQADPTNTAPILFTVVFSKDVIGFGADDILFIGSTASGTLVATVSAIDGRRYTVSVSGMTGSGTVIVSLAVGAAQTSLGTNSLASTSTDNSVTFNLPAVSPPPVTTPPVTPPPVTTPPVIPPVTSPPVTSPPTIPPVVNQNAIGRFGVSPGATGSGSVTIYNSDGSVVSTIPVPGAETRVAIADFTGDGTPDVLTGSGPGGTTITLIDGVSGGTVATLTAFEATFTGGVYVAGGDVNGDGMADMVITPDFGGAPRVMILSGKDQSVIANFMGIEDSNFFGGARVSLADVNGDGRVDLIVAAGFGGGPRVAVFDGISLATGRPVKLIGDFFVFDDTLRNGVSVAGGDVNGDSKADLVFSGGATGSPNLLVLSGSILLASGSSIALATSLGRFFNGDPSGRNGIPVVVKNLDGDAFADVIAAGTDGVSAFAGSSIRPNGTPTELSGFEDILGSTMSGVAVG